MWQRYGIVVSQRTVVVSALVTIILLVLFHTSVAFPSHGWKADTLLPEQGA